MPRASYTTQFNLELNHLKWLSYFQNSLTKNNQFINPDILWLLNNLRYRGVLTRRWREGYKTYMVRIMDDVISLHLATIVYQNVIKQPKRPYNPQKTYLCIRTIKLSQMGLEYLKYIHATRRHQIKVYNDARERHEQEIEHRNTDDTQSDSSNTNQSKASAGIGLALTGFLVMIIGLFLLGMHGNPVIITVALVLSAFLAITGDALVTSSHDTKANDFTEPQYNGYHGLYERSQEAFVIFMSHKNRWKNLITGDVAKRYEILNHGMFRSRMQMWR